MSRGSAHSTNRRLLTVPRRKSVRKDKGNDDGGRDGDGEEDGDKQGNGKRVLLAVLGYVHALNTLQPVINLLTCSSHDPAKGGSTPGGSFRTFRWDVIKASLALFRSST